MPKEEVRAETTPDKEVTEKAKETEEKTVPQKETKTKKKSDSKVEQVSNTKIEQAGKLEEKKNKKAEEKADVVELSSDTEVKNTTEEVKNNNLFRLNETKLETNIVVRGSIDLASINEKTRPARKSRAQRKKERLEREGKATSQRVKDENIKALKKESINEKKTSATDESDDNTKKKRKRIRKGKVNVEKTTDTSTSPSKRKRPILKKPIKKEVSEEDVQKQIKETLARLTRKKSGGRGGARHRRDKRDAVVQRQQAEIKEQEREPYTSVN